MRSGARPILIILAGLALMITGMNSSRPLAIVGLGLIVLGGVSVFMGRMERK